MQHEETHSLQEGKKRLHRVRQPGEAVVVTREENHFIILVVRRLPSLKVVTTTFMPGCGRVEAMPITL